LLPSWLFTIGEKLGNSLQVRGLSGSIYGKIGDINTPLGEYSGLSPKHGEI
jgi:hypothetical protein